ncbi:iron ABC transporter permease [Mammaliicoccus sp. Dog046]|uniref:FecCD family ABC transporter permease n=1 Tax=Mammaliicoccus sp. Dog046 TaxID=3034233 RepID=UPI002B25F44B|nr:iron ABC transporter permease [Mammaliicoccus sp. Dog046]WQK85827.1 iron ABC transporter permease [Mammaliicoccus sp. Dog046]
MIHPKIIKKQRITLIILVIVLIASIGFAMTTGEFNMSPIQYLKTLFGFGNTLDTMILFDFRMPRMLITILAGASLALSGAILQSITKNPLAEPGILGINAGSGFMITLFIVIGTVKAGDFVYVLPLISMLGGMLTAAVIFLFSYKKGEGINPVRMVLIGVGISTALSGLSITVMSTFDQDQMEFISKWLAGNIWGDEWPFVFACLPWLLIVMPFLFYKANVLNMLSTNEQVSVSFGIRSNKERIILVSLAVLLSSAAVSVAGGIGFVGLMGPHIARSIVGPRHQLYLPIAVLIGAIMLVLADTIGKIVLYPNGLPAGIIVAIVGAPYFLYLMQKSNHI